MGPAHPTTAIDRQQRHQGDAGNRCADPANETAAAGVTGNMPGELFDNVIELAFVGHRHCSICFER
jgi:hypothetical protein